MPKMWILTVIHNFQDNESYMGEQIFTTDYKKVLKAVRKMHERDGNSTKVTVNDDLSVDIIFDEGETYHYDSLYDFQYGCLHTIYVSVANILEVREFEISRSTKLTSYEFEPESDSDFRFDGEDDEEDSDEDEEKEVVVPTITKEDKAKAAKNKKAKDKRKEKQKEKEKTIDELWAQHSKEEDELRAKRKIIRKTYETAVRKLYFNKMEKLHKKLIPAVTERRKELTKEAQKLETAFFKRWKRKIGINHVECFSLTKVWFKSYL